MPILRTRDVTLSCDDLGEAEPALLLMPGWCVSRAVFQPLLPPLARRRRTLALDWRGHGASGRPAGEFGQDELVEDALAVVEASRAGAVVPVALAHAGWVAIELRRRLGARVPGIVLVDWMVLGAPPAFEAVLRDLQSETAWRGTVDALFDGWLKDVDAPRLARFVRDDMGSFGFDMWSRAGRAIGGAFARYGSPLRALAELQPGCPVLHLCSRPGDPGGLAPQEAFARANPWFRVVALDSASHFPMFEVPDEMAGIIDAFAAAP
jgi:pimeloyl-ACP methyl ester carboxylesterase